MHSAGTSPRLDKVEACHLKRCMPDVLVRIWDFLVARSAHRQAELARSWPATLLYNIYESFQAVLPCAPA